MITKNKAKNTKINLMRAKKILLALLLVVMSSAPSFAKEYDDPIEQLFENIYAAWNEHDIDKLFSYYSNNFVTSDGIDKTGYRELTEKLWDNYPDIQLKNQKRTLRSQDQYATISVIDLFYGTSKEENEQIKKKGELNAISQGQIFLKKYGQNWKIESDKIHFELVTVYYGNAKEYLDNHQIYFGAPEQVKAAEQYTASLYFILPENVQATATINHEIINNPPKEDIEESFQSASETKLERLFAANSLNRNELVSATIVLSKGIIEPKLEGLLYISKRVNVLAQAQEVKADNIATNAFGEEPAEEEDKAKE